MNGTTSLKLVGTMTLTINASTSFVFASSSGTAIDITTAGLTMPTCTFGSGGSYRLADNWSASGTTWTLNAGTLNTNAKTVTIGTFTSSNSSTRTFNISGTTLTIDGSNGTVYNTSTTTNLTWTTNTSTLLSITGSGTVAAPLQFNTGGKTLSGDVTFTGAGVLSIQAAMSMRNLTFTGTAVKTTEIVFPAGTTTVTGTFTVTGNSTVNRLWVRTSTAAWGTARTISVGTAVSLTNVDFIDIAATGAAGTWTGTSLGDCGGNSGITFDASATQTWQGTSGGNWSNSANWTSRVPLPQDDVVINNAFSASQTVTTDMPRWGRTIDFTGVSGSPGWTWSGGLTSSGYYLFGSLTMAAGIGTITSGGLTLSLMGRSSYTITTGGKSVPGGGTGVTVQAPTGTYTLQDDWTSSASFFVAAGTFDDANHNMSAFAFGGTSSGNVTRLWKFGTGTYTCSLGSTSTAWNFPSTMVGFSNTGNPIVTCNGGGGAVTKTFNLGGISTYASITISPTSNATFAFTVGAGTVTISTFRITQTSGTAATVQFEAGKTITFGSFLVQGQSTATKINLNTTVGGSALTLTLTAPGAAEASRASVTDMHVTGGDGYLVDSTDVSGNTGWTAMPPNYVPSDRQLLFVQIRTLDRSKTKRRTYERKNRGDAHVAPWSYVCRFGPVSGNWSDPTKWLNGQVPTADDDAYFDDQSAACTVDIAAVCRNLDFTIGTGYTQTFTMTGQSVSVGSTRAAAEGGGSITLASTMTLTGGRFLIVNCGTNSGSSIRTNGIVIPALTINNNFATTDLADNLTVTNDLTLTQGSITGTTRTVTLGSLVATSSNLGNFIIETAITLTGTGTVLNHTGVTHTIGPSGVAPMVYNITDTSASAKTIKVYPAPVTLSRPASLNITGGGTGTVTIDTNGTGHLGAITVGAPKTVLFQSAKTAEMTDLILNSTAANPITIKSTSGGSAATLTGFLRKEFLFITFQDITIDPTVPQVLDVDGTDSGGNTHIDFLPPGRIPEHRILPQLRPPGVAAVVRQGHW